MCCFFNKAYLRIPFDIIKQYKVILLYHCWNHVVFSFIVVKDAASHSTNYSLPRGGGAKLKLLRIQRRFWDRFSGGGRPSQRLSL